jgi:glycerol-3-phosphate dehydrogenase
VTHEAVAAGLYYEGRVSHAERLGVELVLGGLAARPQSVVRTYIEVLGKPQNGTSEQSCDAALTLLGKPRLVSTVVLQIGGGFDYPRDDKSRDAMFGRIGTRGSELLDRYGTTALIVRKFADTMQDRPLSSLPGYRSGEIAYICAHENVRHLSDLLLRRTAITIEGLLTPKAIHETATIAAEVPGWNRIRTKAEIDHAKAELACRSVKNVRSDAAPR